MRKGALALASAVVIGLTMPAGAAAADWLPESRVSESGEDDSESSSPRVAVSPAGDATVVWEDQVPTGSSGSDQRIQARTYGADGSVGPIVNLSATDDYLGTPDLDVADDGTVTVVWPNEERVEFVRLDAEGQPLGSPAFLTPGTEDAYDVNVDVNASGEALVGWYDDEARYLRISAAGVPGPIRDASDIASEPGRYVESGAIVALADDGRGFMAWRYFEDSASCCAYGVQGRVVEADDTLGPIETLSSGDGYPEEIQTVIDSAGQATALWSAQDAGSSFRSNIFATQVGPDGQAGEAEVVSDPGNHARIYDAEVDSTDRVRFAFEESGSDDRVRIGSIAADGTVGAPQTVATGDVDYGDLALFDDDSGIVGFVRRDEDSGTYRAAGRAVGADDQPTGAERWISPPTGDVYYDPPEVAAGARDGFAAYERVNPDFGFDEFLEVWGAAYDGTAPELATSIPQKGAPGQELTMGAIADDRTAVGFAWDFGDGASASGQIVEHAYSQAGSYPVVVTATDASGNRSSESATVQITEPDRGPDPGPDPDSDPASGSCARTQIGTAGADVLLGTATGDRLVGRGGDDELRGKRGSDCMRGGGGDDDLRGGKGPDLLMGNGGNDVIRAGAGKDLVDCGRGGRDVAVIGRGDSAVNCETVRRRR